LPVSVLKPLAIDSLAQRQPHGVIEANDVVGAVYRHIYHEEHGNGLDAISGELSYSPVEGLALPPIEIKELAWL